MGPRRAHIYVGVVDGLGSAAGWDIQEFGWGLGCFEGLSGRVAWGVAGWPWTAREMGFNTWLLDVCCAREGAQGLRSSERHRVCY